MRQVLACTGGLDIDPGLAADLAEHQIHLAFANSHRDCAAQLRELQPDAVVLSVADDPHTAGRRCAEFRRDTGAALLALSHRYSVPQAVAVLDAGADDYMVLHENAAELAARIRALLRRSARAAEQRSFVVGELHIDAESRTVRTGDRQAKLTPLEFRLLACLAANPGRSLSPNTLLRAVQGYDLDAQEAAQIMKALVWRLRQKIEADPSHPRYILNVRGSGYILDRRGTASSGGRTLLRDAS
jgi:DNA-binding response OmpR family regulator